MKRILHKSWVQHLLFWLLFLNLWTLRELVYHSNYPELLFTNTIMALFWVPYIYLNLYVLVPKLLLKQRYWGYLAAISTTTALFVFLIQEGMYALFTRFYEVSPEEVWFAGLEGNLIHLSELLLIYGLTMALFFTQQWYQKDRYTQELEKRNLQTELKQLKSQINPHYVFNTLNTIYFLMEQDNEEAKELLLRFSDNLSHQLYDSRQDRIPLSKEIRYLRNYMAMERIRHGDLLTFDFRCSAQESTFLIPPMLLMPLVENAFKHSRSAEPYAVRINLEVHGSMLELEVKNTIPATRAKGTKENRGIGLQNVKRRLELLFPQDYQFDFFEKEGWFYVRLQIPMEKDLTPSGAEQNTRVDV